jgi:hypothetical protein
MKYHLPGFVPGSQVSNHFDMVGCSSAAPSYNINQTFLKKLFYLGTHLLRALVILTKLIGESGIRISTYKEGSLLIEHL